MKFVPADSSIAELERKAAECEQKAEQEKEPLASQLKEEARLYRGWIAALKSKNGPREGVVTPASCRCYGFCFTKITQ